MSAERRRFPRASQPFDAHCRPREMGDAWIPVTVLNLSANGVRFRNEHPFALGAEMEFKFQPTGFLKPLVVRGRVVWHEMQASGVVEHGIELRDVSVEQQQQLDHLVRFLTHA